MTMDELMLIFDKAYCANLDDPETRISSDRAGIRAVVAALRDNLCDKVDHFALDGRELANEFNEILGDAGEKAAGERGGSIAEASHPAADPSVCEWTLTHWSPDASWYERKCVGKVFERDLRHLACPSCGKPISFREKRHERR